MLLLSSSCMGQKIDNSTVADLNLNRYLGKWFEIARFDHGFERGISHAQASYTLVKDGRVMVINSGIKNNKVKASQGVAKLTDTPGLLRVSFFRPFYSDYRVMMIDDYYRYALVGSKTKDYLWILSRTPKMDEIDTCIVLYEARSRGYDTNKLIWVDQRCQ